MIEIVDESNNIEVLEIIGSSPLENIILIADVTQLKDWCTVRLLRKRGRIQSIFSLYRDLDFLAGAFWSKNLDSLRRLIASFGTTLRGSMMVFICTSQQLEILTSIAADVEPFKERQMVMEDPSKLICDDVSPVHRLSMEDAEELRELYRVCGTPAWTPNALNLGPFFGVRDERGTIVSVAGVHFVTEYGAEIGNVATHPNHRRKGYAMCCIAAVTKELLEDSQRVILHFFEENVAARQLYERMGFEYSEADPVYFAKAKLP
ncbi:MAG: GNAT family N-acetyltransferase [Candidatus Thorarchaeota archaeon]